MLSELDVSINFKACFYAGQYCCAWEMRGREVMLKNIFRGLIVLCGSIVLPLAASAGIFSNPYNHYYIDIGGAAYYLQQPKFEVGTKGVNPSAPANTTAPLAKNNVNGVAPALHLAGGYQFMNCNDNFFSKIFGHEEAFEADINYFYLDSSVDDANLGLGNAWYIDGSGSILSPNSPTSLYDFKLSSKVQDLTTGLYFKGKVYTTNPRLTMERYVGLIYSYYNNQYDFNLKYNPGGKIGTDSEKFDVTSNDFGLALGSQLNYQVSKHFVPFADLEVRLLAINSNLHATQNTPVSLKPNMTVNDSASAFNYEAIAALGVNYLFNDSVKSPSVGLKAGLDHINYVPRIVPPNHVGDKPVHIVGEAVNNTFAMLDVHIPFG